MLQYVCGAKSFFVALCYPKNDLRLQLKAAFYFFFLMAYRFAKTSNHFEEMYE